MHREVLDQDTDETLDGTECNTVDHDRTMFLAVCTDVLQLKSLRKLEVKLDGTALPGSSDRIYQMEVDLRTVECAVAFVYHIIQSQLIQAARSLLLPSPSLRRFPCCLPDVWKALHDI